jgi:potassium/hydrogen antiporter
MLDFVVIVVLIGSALIVLSVFTSLISYRIGAPLLLIFLGLGLAVGEDGLGIQFDNATAAFFIGSVALAIILFDSGFNTRFETVSRAAWPALTLSTFGVLVTTGLVGVVTHYLSGLSWTASFLLGAIISSTDAAAVFFLLRVGGLKIRERVRATLEVESGSNDPMAVFITITLVEMIMAGPDRQHAFLDFASTFVAQIGLGAIMGLAGGWAIAKIINRIQLEPGLYPVMVLGLALFLFALTSMIGGSGFLAAYVGGLMAGNLGTRAIPMLRRFQDGLTWLAQIGMFLMLGLLAQPSAFGNIWIQGLFIAFFLILIARPFAVWLSLLPFGFKREETAFIGWVGLRGAVSILLAIIPMMAAIPVGQAFFNIAFIVVLTSLLVQGWTIRPMARWLGIVVPPAIGPVEKVELELPGNAKHELVVYRIAEDSPVGSGERIPRWARPSLIVREGRSLRLHEAGRLRPGDLVYIFAVPRFTRLLDRLFAGKVEISESDTEFFGDFSFPGDTVLSNITDQYDISVDPEQAKATLAALLARRHGSDIHRGDRMSLGQVELIVRDVNDEGEVATVGISLSPQDTATRLPLFQNLDEIVANIRLRFAAWQAGRAAGSAFFGRTDAPGAAEDETPAPGPSRQT